MENQNQTARVLQSLRVLHHHFLHGDKRGSKLLWYNLHNAEKTEPAASHQLVLTEKIQTK